ncbi:MAG: protein kinase [Planctomycetota bacterium]
MSEPDNAEGRTEIPGEDAKRMPTVNPLDGSVMVRVEPSPQRAMTSDSGATENGNVRHPVESLASQVVDRLRDQPGWEAETLLDDTSVASDDAGSAEKLKELMPVIQRLEDVRRQIIQRPDGLASLGSSRPEKLDDFRLIRQIGRGGMGVVFEAEQVSLGRSVAVKVLPGSLLQDEKHITRFQREAQLAASLHHTHIVPVFGVGSDQGYHYYVMQLIDGIGLDECLAAGEDFGCDQVVDMGIQEARALAHAHRQGILHRDIKPANLLREASGKLWITDFGVAKAMETLEATRSTDAIGTLRYMAPEQATGNADCRSDVYSLGLTLYELLAGRPAWDDETIRRGVVGRHGIQAPTKLRKMNPAVSLDLQTVIHHAIEFSAADRYADADHFAADLQRLANREPIRARRHGPVELAVRWARRRPAIAALSLLSLLLLISVAVTASVGYFHVQRSLEQTVAAEINSRATADVATDALDQLFNRFSSSDLSSPDWQGAADAVTDQAYQSPAVSRQTADLLQDLVVYYDRIAQLQAERSATDVSGPASESSTIAHQHIGQLHQRLGNYESAEQAFQRALELNRNSWQEDPAVATEQNASRVIQEAALLNRIGLAQRLQGMPSQSESTHARALESLQSVSAGVDARPVTRYAVARTHFLLALRIRPGFGPESMPDALALSPSRPPHKGPPHPYPPKREGRSPRRPPDHSPRSKHGRSQHKLPKGLSEQGKAHLEEAIGLLETLAKEYPDRIVYRVQLAAAYREQTQDTLIGNGDQGRDVDDRAVAILQDLLEKHPQHNVVRWELIRTLAYMNVFVPLDKEELTIGLKRLSQAVELAESMVAEFPWVTAYELELAHLYFKQGRLLRQKAEQSRGPDRFDADHRCATSHRQAVLEMSRLLRQQPTAIGYRCWLALFRFRLAEVLWQVGEESESIRVLEQSTLDWQAAEQALPDDELIQRGLQANDDFLIDAMTGR